MDETTSLFPREIAVLRAVQGSFRQLGASRRPVEALVLQIANRMDDIGDRVPGYWKRDGGKRVRSWLMCPSGLPAYPRIRARGSVSPPRYASGSTTTTTSIPRPYDVAHTAPHSFASKPRRTAQRPPSPPERESFPQDTPITSPPVKRSSALPQYSFKEESPRGVLDFEPVALDINEMSFGEEVEPIHQPTRKTHSHSHSHSSPKRTVPPAFEESAGEADDTIGSPSSVVAASWKLYDEALRRFSLACDESDHLVGVGGGGGGGGGGAALSFDDDITFGSSTGPAPSERPLLSAGFDAAGGGADKISAFSTTGLKWPLSLQTGVPNFEDMSPPRATRMSPPPPVDTAKLAVGVVPPPYGL